MDIDWIVTLWSAPVVLVATTVHGITGFGPTAVAGGRQDPANLDFRSETCLTDVATWRADNPIRTDVRTKPLQEGDALLLYGPGDQTCGYDPGPGFLWLHKPHQEEAPHKLRHLGKWAALIMAGVIALAAFNLLPISVAALGGAALMVFVSILPPDGTASRVLLDQRLSQVRGRAGGDHSGSCGSARPPDVAVLIALSARTLLRHNFTFFLCFFAYSLEEVLSWAGC